VVPSLLLCEDKDGIGIKITDVFVRKTVFLFSPREGGMAGTTGRAAESRHNCDLERRFFRGTHVCALQ
jgi:hypothetical protein